MLAVKFVFNAVVLALLLASCLPTSSVVVAPSSNVPVAVRQGEVTISALPPAGWQAFIDGTHLILTNQLSNPSQSVVINVWVPAEDVMNDIPRETGTSTAEVLREITNTPRLIGNAIASTPQPFRWMHYDGAYYVLNNGTDTATLVIALTPAQPSQMIVINITAKEAVLHRLSEAAGAALESVFINQHPLGADLFSMLPQPLEVPTSAAVNEPS
jgi:hypothetical protein